MNLGKFTKLLNQCGFSKSTKFNPLRRIPAPSRINYPKVMSSPPAVGALAAATAIASPKYWRANPLIASSNALNLSFFGTPTPGAWSVLGATYPNYLYMIPQPPTTGGGSSVTRIEFLFDGTTLELLHKGTIGYQRMWVDGELVDATPWTIPNDGQVYFRPITFATRAVRHIAIDAYNIAFGGVVTGPADSIVNAGKQKPRCLIIGDSFCDTTGSSYKVDGYGVQFGAAMGWDCVLAAQGGSGYVAAGSYTGKYSTRVAFYAAEKFDVIIVQGSVNDVGAGPSATVGTEAASLFATLQTTFPGVPIIATSPMYHKGVHAWSSYLLTVRDAIRTAAAAAGIYFVDLLEMPLLQTPAATTLASSASASATSISTNLPYAINSTIEIGTGTANVERRVVDACSGAGPYTITVKALTNAHSSGDVVKQVGACLWTGSGYIGATTGYGNCDLIVSSDGVHPSSAGHELIAKSLAQAICLQNLVTD